VIGAGDDFRAQDAQASDAEGTREFVDKPARSQVTTLTTVREQVEVIFPLDDRTERADGVGGSDGSEQLVHHLNVEGDLAAFGIDEVAVGQQTEMRRDLVITDAGDALGDEFLLGHELLGFVAGGEGGAVFQALKRGTVKGSVKGIFVTVPEVNRRAAGIAESMDIKHPQALGIEHKFCEGRGRVGIINITLLPESCHHQMIFA